MMETKQDRKGKDDSILDDSGIDPNQVLRITRTFKNGQGGEFTRTELVRKPLVIETYVKVRNTKDDTFIRQFATMDDQVKEEMKKEKRRNQEQQKMGIPKKPHRKEKLKPDLKLKCGACGQVGHMKTNKACPKFQGEEFEGLGLAAGRSVAMTLEDEERMTMKMEMIDEDELVNVEGTKVKF